MIRHPYHLYTERTEPAKNTARFYALEISETLFGEACLIRRWAHRRLGQCMIHHFEREDEAVKLFLDITRKKKARGYRPKPILSLP
ncbi:WGR domain-containing protein [Rhizobium sp. BR 314]